MSYRPIEDYGIIGDMRTVALVGMDGSIDFMCYPYFDSPSVFAAMLDDREGGRFRISPVFDRAVHRQLYLPETNVLFTRFLSADGVAEVSDFMPLGEGDGTSRLVRRAKTVRGEVRYRMLCEPRFDYGRASHTTEEKDGTALFRSRGPDGTVLRLRSSVPLRIENGAASADFTLGVGETALFVLEGAEPGVPSPAAEPHYAADAFKETSNFWRRWLARSSYRGRWRETIDRSALTLKLLISAEHGSLVAAPTFGLPEEIGGERNWDYRYIWIRDASFTLYALTRLGFMDEAAAFVDWIGGRCLECGPHGTLQIMYGIDGRHDLSEEALPHFEGYRGSSPVRVGNGAYDQLQLDIYGELMDTVYIYNKYGEPISHDDWDILTRSVDWVCENWRRKDEGIWEVRGGRQEFLYSRLMCWVALDRGVRLARKRSLPAPLDRWCQVRDEIYREIFDAFWDPQRGAFIQHKGSRTLDASCLLMPLVKFISPTDPRWLSTLKAVEEELVDDALVFRYRTGEAAPDGLAGDEGTFNMCSFWYVECLARAGDLQKARFNFEKMLGYANHVGLYAEELGPHGEHLGNFPQAFTHLGLISAAHYLDRALGD
ncbi:MAG: glycoside hydrolase family 15 protein [Alphaproteobacteria bacterium]